MAGGLVGGTVRGMGPVPPGLTARARSLAPTPGRIAIRERVAAGIDGADGL